MDFELAFTDKEITPWGGMALMKRMLDVVDPITRTGLQEV